MTDTLVAHKYTVLEIARMRDSIQELMFPWQWVSPTTSGRPGLALDDYQRVEAQLRTYMLAGIRPEELETLQKERHEAFNTTRPAA